VAGLTAVRAAVALGSNLGDRAAHLAFAQARLGQVLANAVCSSVHETDPVDVPGVQPRFLNAAVVGDAAVGPRELVQTLLALERERGRGRPFVNAPRTLDLDLVLFGDVVVHEPDLIVPHPRFRRRRFVLEPLAEIAPDLVDPVTNLTVLQLLEQLA
jgi:2-amino-4-hydroxy-6-hydroxymethyldihydropteridine diphosphokinase